MKKLIFVCQVPLSLMLFDLVEVSFCLHHAKVCAQLNECDLCQISMVYYRVKKKEEINTHAIHIYFEISQGAT